MEQKTGDRASVRSQISSTYTRTHTHHIHTQTDTHMSHVVLASVCERARLRELAYVGVCVCTSSEEDESSGAKEAVIEGI